MASTNLIHHFESKLEAQNAILEARKNKALASRLTFIQWTTGIGPRPHCGRRGRDRRYPGAALTCLRRGFSLKTLSLT